MTSIASGDNLPDLRDEPSQPSTQGTPSEADGTAADVGASENAGQSNGETAGSGSLTVMTAAAVIVYPRACWRQRQLRLTNGDARRRQRSTDTCRTGGNTRRSIGKRRWRVRHYHHAKLKQEQRAAARAQAAKRPPTPIGSANSGSAGQGNGSYENGTADAGGYTAGGGMGGAAVGGRVPQNTAKYPPPTDIPNGNNDDVVARQLREAAMREPDPAVRERLWDEYRKYTGLEK